jgi:radical SAM family uncharacterized protein
MHPQEVEQSIQHILPRVQKPGRYTGGELNQVVKDWDDTNLHVALIFPDVYDLGMSNLGLAILYDILNREEDILAERAYAPWPDMEAEMRKSGIPLYSLETKHILSDFDILGFTLPYETVYTNTLNLIDLAGIPLYSKERQRDDPVLLAGGHTTLNPEPMAPFFDAFVIGEGEEVILEIARCVQGWKASGRSRAELHRDLAMIWGVYVPSLYQVHYHQDGTIAGVEPLQEDVPFPILKRILGRMPKPITRFIVPFVDVTHNRIPIEIMRGCTRGCRFCQAGMITRPVRERPIPEILEAIEESSRRTGLDEVGLLSLSSSDYTEILALVHAVNERFREQKIKISLPSLRIETVSVELMDLLQGHSSRSGFTLAPEAATERMREIINKPISEEQLLETVREIYGRGWHTIKLYFMIGHPSETLEDVEAIAHLCKKVLAEGRKIMGKRAKVNAGVSTFIPKPHTPFQWTPCDTSEQIMLKQDLLRRELRGPGLKINWNEPGETMLEAWLSRGDRRISEVIHLAWKRGAKFDAWHEHFDFDRWQQAFHEAGLDPAFYSHRERPIDEVLPWDHIDAAVKKQFLAEDYIMSHQGMTRMDCRGQCYACGILPKYADLRRENPGPYWQCPEVRSPAEVPLESFIFEGSRKDDR